VTDPTSALLLLATVVAVALALTLAAYLPRAARERSLARIARGHRTVVARVASGPRPFARRRRWPALAVGGGIAVALAVASLPWPLVFSLATVGAMVTWLGEDVVMSRREGRIEAQLADAIDIMIGAVRAGAGPVEALDAATRATGSPLRPELEEVVGRFKLGDDVRDVMEELARRVPLEGFRLFALTLAVNWDAGGNIAPALATTARTIRDRIDLGRRVRAQAAEGQLSAIGIVAIAYALAYIFWQADPERTEAFARSPGGIRAIALVVFLQTLGLGWVWRIVRVRY